MLEWGGGAGSRQQAVSAHSPKVPAVAVAVYGVALGRPDVRRVLSSIGLGGRPFWFQI